MKKSTLKSSKKLPQMTPKIVQKCNRQLRRVFFRSQKTELFHELFFLFFCRKMSTEMASKVEKIMSKMTLGMKSKTQDQNVLKVMPWDLWKSSFRLEGLSKIIKTRGANNCENMSKNDVKITPESLKYEPWNSTKNDAQKHTQKIRKIIKNGSKNELPILIKTQKKQRKSIPRPNQKKTSK